MIFGKVWNHSLRWLIPLLLLSSSLTPPLRGTPWAQFSNRVPINMKYWNNNRPNKIVIWNTRLKLCALGCVLMRQKERVNYVLKTQRHNNRFSIFSRVKTSNVDLKLGSITHIHHCLVIGNAGVSFSLCLRCSNKKIAKQFFVREEITFLEYNFIISTID